MSVWALKWRSETRLDGVREHLIHENLLPKLFKTRREARAAAEKQFGYIRNRPDLQSEPHCSRIPQTVRVDVTEFRPK